MSDSDRVSFGAQAQLETAVLTRIRLSMQRALRQPGRYATHPLPNLSQREREDSLPVLTSLRRARSL